jgi:hypothetical protein
MFQNPNPGASGRPSRHVPPPDIYDAVRRRAEEYRRAEMRWHRAMPECLVPFLDRMELPSRQDDMGPVQDALRSAYPDRHERILAVLKWYGSGMGPWSGYPAYEGYAERILDTFVRSHIVRALQRRWVTAAHLEGAARYFACSASSDRGADAPIPPAVGRLLLEHCRAGGDEDKIAALRSALG